MMLQYLFIVSLLNVFIQKAKVLTKNETSTADREQEKSLLLNQKLLKSHASFGSVFA